MPQQSSPLFFKSIRVSQLSRYASCPKRVKLELTRNVKYSSKFSRNKINAMVRGSKQHFWYSLPYKNFYRRLFRYKLGQISHVFQREVDGVMIRGIPDDYLVDEKGYVSVIELKTTSKKRLWTNEVAVAKLQLELYIFIMKPYIESLGYKMNKEHYLEIHSQKDNTLMKRYTIIEDKSFEKKVKYILRSLRGLERITPPPMWICRKCPKQVRDKCDWIDNIYK